MATAFISCGDEDGIIYVRQDQLEIKSIPVTSVLSPYLLPDGSLAMLEKGESKGVFIVQEPQQTDPVESNPDVNQSVPSTDTVYKSESAFYLVKLSKDGTITKSPQFNYNMVDYLNNVSDVIYSIDITANNNFYCKYYSTNELFVSKFDVGEYLDGVDMVTSDDTPFWGCAAISDSEFVIIRGNDPVMYIYDSQMNLKQQCSLPYLKYTQDGNYYVHPICGNIMIIKPSQIADNTVYEFYVYSLSGELLNYGSFPYLPDRIVNIVDPATNTFTHAYAITSDAPITDEDGTTSQSGGSIIRLDQNGRAIYEFTDSEFTQIFNVTEHNGRLIVAGVKSTYSFDTFFNAFGHNIDSETFYSNLSGLIVDIDAATGGDLKTYPISLEGSAMPFAVVPDDNDRYYVYMARFLSDQIRQRNSSSDDKYGNSIFIYHIDDLNKLNNE